MSAPSPFTVKTPLVKLALPGLAGEPISVSPQPEGRLVLGLMVRLTVLECVRLPLTPVIVSVNEPLEAVLVVEMLSVDEPEPLIEPGLNVALAPEGNPLTLKLTVPVKPLAALTFAV